MRMMVAGFMAVAAVGLSACEPTRIGPGAETRGQREEARDEAPRAPVVLPPAIRASRSYRCADNSLLMVEWYADDRSATVRAGEDGKPVRVLGRSPGTEMVADGGWSLKGAHGDAKVTFASPSHPKPMGCHV